jgi:hypothetical protein
MAEIASNIRDMKVVDISRPLELFVAPSAEVMNRSDWYKYKIFPVWRAKILDKGILEARPGLEFNKFLEKHVNSYVFEKKEPPADIATAVMNIADDFLAGREPVIRAGDYISLQNYMRKEVG